MLHPVKPIQSVDLFSPLHEELLALLRQLAPADWQRPTPAPAWSVKDVAAHILDTDIRRLAYQRDELAPPDPPWPITGYYDLVAYLNELNAQWVTAARRISPALLIQLLELICPQVHQLFKSLDLLAPAAVGVGWAGEQQSATWFDIAREYTEKWVHQQQIREAVGVPRLTSRRWLHPVLDTFLRGLPHAYRDVDASELTSVVVRITGEAGGTWSLIRQDSRWVLLSGNAPRAAAVVEIDQETAWRLFTKNLAPEAARSRTHIDGDEMLGRQLLMLVAIMA